RTAPRRRSWRARPWPPPGGSSARPRRSPPPPPAPLGRRTWTRAWPQPTGQTLLPLHREAVSNACTVKKWVVLPAGFSEAGGELTPTLKLKRRAVGEKYARLIEDMYGNHVV
ncbi:unnamed protein product, partial [Heterosigma akashiwo]